MNPTKPTPSLALTQIKSSLESLKGMPDNYYASLALFRDIVSYLDRLEKDTPCSPTTPIPTSSTTSTPTATAPSASGERKPASVGVNHQKCDRCGKPLHVHMGYYMPCVCDAAASPAGAGGTTSTNSHPSDKTPRISPSMGDGASDPVAITAEHGSTSSTTTPPTPAGDDRLPEVQFGCGTDGGTVSPTPAGEGRVPVPEWCEKGLVHEGGMILGTGIGAAPFFKSPFAHQCKTPESAEWFCGIMNYGLASLRADRDRWRERANAKEGHICELQALRGLDAQRLRDLISRIAELEAAQARQMVTIEKLSARHDGDEVLVAMLEADLAAVRKASNEHGVNWLLDRAREEEGKATPTSA
jgi:uncharacterized coiled-coil protein SlyX